MEQDIREKVIAHIYQHIDKHGYCRVGWAARMVLNTKTEIPVVDKEQIANLCIQTGEYMKERAAKDYTDWNIVKNPLYEKHKLELDMLASTTQLNRTTQDASKRNSNISIINIIVGALNVCLLVLQIVIAYKKPDPPAPVINNYIAPSTIKTSDIIDTTHMAPLAVSHTSTPTYHAGGRASVTSSTPTGKNSLPPTKDK